MGKANRLYLDRVARMVADAVAVNVALLLAFQVRVVAILWLENAQTDLSPQALLRGALSGYGRVAPFLTLLCLLCFYLSGFYTHGRAYRGRYKALIVFQAVTLSYAIFGLFLYLLFDVAPWFPRTVWLGSWLLTLLFVGGMRLWSALWRANTAAQQALDRPQKKTIQNVLVMGGAGYVGAVLVRQLLDKGYRVKVMDSLVYGDDGIRALYSHPRFEFVQGDLRNIETVVRALRSTDAVVHLGAVVGDPACDLDEKLTLDINLAATRTVAEVARGFGIQRFVFASTCSVYGASDEVLDERSILNPVSGYARSKMESEDVLLSLASQDFAPVILRFGTFYGLSPRARFDLVVNLLVAKAVRDKRITIFGGDQWRPFIHVDDGARAVVKCLEAPIESVEGQIFNVGSDEQNYRIADIGDLISKLIPGTEVVQQEGDGSEANYRVSFAKIRKHLDFKPAFSVEDGILEIEESLRQGGILDYQDTRYSNYKLLSESARIRRMRRVTSTPLFGAGPDGSPAPAAAPLGPEASHPTGNGEVASNDGDELDLESADWAFDRCYRILSYEFRIRSELSASELHLDRLLEPFRINITSGLTTYHLVKSDSNDFPIAIYLGEQPVYKAPYPSDVVSYLLVEVNARAIHDVHDLLALRAAAASWNGDGILLPAPMDAGRTPLVAGLTRAGFSYLTDEAALIDPATARIVPYPKSLALDPTSLEAIHDLGTGPDLPVEPEESARLYHVRAEDLRPGSLGRMCPVRYVIKPEYKEGAPTVLEPMDRATTLRTLEENAFNLGGFGAKGLEMLRELSENAAAYRLVTGDLAGGVKAIQELVQN